MAMNEDGDLWRAKVSKFYLAIVEGIFGNHLIYGHDVPTQYVVLLE